MRIDAKPIKLNIIQVLARTGDHINEEVEAFHEKVNSVRRKCKPGEILVVMEYIYAKHGRVVVEEYWTILEWKKEIREETNLWKGVIAVNGLL